MNSLERSLEEMTRLYSAWKAESAGQASRMLAKRTLELLMIESAPAIFAALRYYFSDDGLGKQGATEIRRLLGENEALKERIARLEGYAQKG